MLIKSYDTITRTIYQLSCHLYCYYIFSPILLFAVADLNIWFKGMWNQYGKLTAKKSGNGTKEHTARGLVDHQHLHVSGGPHFLCAFQAVVQYKHSFIICTTLF